MKCNRCSYPTEVVSEYYDFEEQVLIRDTLCTKCNSVLIEKFYRNSRFVSDWMDLNVRDRKDGR